MLHLDSCFVIFIGIQKHSVVMNLNEHTSEVAYASVILRSGSFVV